MSTLDDLRAARKLIQRGWGKGRLHERHLFRRDKYCVVGALASATDNRHQLHVAREAVVSALPKEFRFQDIMSWNDDSHRRKEEVLALFDRAIRTTQTKQWQGRFTPQTVISKVRHKSDYELVH